MSTGSLSFFLAPIPRSARPFRPIPHLGASQATRKWPIISDVVLQRLDLHNNAYDENIRISIGFTLIIACERRRISGCRVFFSGEKRQPEIRLRSQATLIIIGRRT